MRPRHWLRGATALLAIAGTSLSGARCSSSRGVLRTVVEPASLKALDGKSPYLKVHLSDGRLYLLAEWKVDEARGIVSGSGQLLGADRRVAEQGRFSVPVDQVALFETNVMPAAGLRAKSIVTGISIALTAVCLTTPKACFGSCPTFYASDGERDSLMAEGFSTSIAPALEYADVDALFRARPRDPRFEVRMTNEALETHVVRYVQLLAARRPAGGRVLATASGTFREATELKAPSACEASEGDCRAAVTAFDGVERTSRTDGVDLATREVIDLAFDAPAAGELGLVIGARQTLLTTFLFYQTLAYMGPSAPAWLAQLERGGKTIVDRAHAMRDVLGGIEVQVPEGEGWRSVGESHETGPLASDVRVVPLPPLRGPVRLRLLLTRGHWRLDYLALARLGGTVAPRRLLPLEVRREGGGRVALGRPLTTLPGEAYRFAFTVPEPAREQELFLESRGYYLEWLRQEWLAEEDAAKLLQILWTPRAALRALAPAFREQEVAMEAAFWGSRYGSQR